jgi:16S rRNA (cytidine1402-2'-O)-methyltransferase
MLKPGLYVVGTPIGHLEDITFRAVSILKEAHTVVAEDTRETRKLLERYGIAAPMLSCHKFNEASRIEQIVARIRAGEALALVTDSGMPAVSDPGSRVVAACRAAGLYVTVAPGPSAVTAAMALSGFGGRGFLFEGFLSHKSAARRKRLAALLAWDMPVVLFESPHRLLKLLDELKDLAPSRQVFIGRELTKHFEELLWGRAGELAARFAGRGVKGELVVVVSPETM